MKYFASAFALLFFLSVAYGFTAIDNTKCGSGSGCLGYPKNCYTTAVSGCSAFIKWTGSATGDKGYLDIEMYVNQSIVMVWPYVSVAFSSDDDMPNNPYVACYRNPASSFNIAVAWGYITGKSSPAMDSGSTPAAGYISNKASMLTISGGNNIVQCRLRMMMTVSDAKYNLKLNTPYYALGAYGTMLSSSVFAKHVHDMHASEAKILASGNAGNAVYTNWMLLVVLVLISKFLME